jgi:hypothetical protein
MNHYEYLEKNLDNFWKEIFNKTLDEMWCSGIIVSHGDKGSQYKQRWEEKNIPFNRGMLIYMLTYTRELDRPKWESCQFVIDKYEKYLPIIEKIERLNK